MLKMVVAAALPLAAIAADATSRSWPVAGVVSQECVAAVAAIRRELGGKWAVYVVLWQCAVAWLAALLVQIIGGFL